MMAYKTGFLPPTWKTLIEFLASTFGLVKPWLLWHLWSEAPNDSLTPTLPLAFTLLL